MTHEITPEAVAQFQKKMAHTPGSAALQRAVMNNGIKATSQDPTAASRLNRTFSVELDTGKVSNQKKSGRCWLFSTLNTLRHDFAKTYKVKDFELSENYLSFWDRFEKANAFYEHIIETADLPADHRLVSWLLAAPDTDGGQFHNAAALVEKYGLVPKDVMPETFNSDNTNDFSEVLNLKLRKDAIVLRKLANSSASDQGVADQKRQFLAEVYRICSYAFGTPPESFDFVYRDDDKKYHRDPALTPQAFAKKYFKRNLADYVVVTNAPNKPYNQIFTLPMENNVIGGPDVAFFNVDLATMKAATLKQLQAGETIWFGNDVLQQMNRQAGLLDSKLYRQAELFGIDLSLSKADRLTYGEGAVSHAMTLTGVDLVDGEPTKWKVENSWGEKNGEQGYFVMSDEWYDDFVYECVIDRKYLEPAQIQALSTQPTVITPWDSLA